MVFPRSKRRSTSFGKRWRVSRSFVVNASPLILLARIQRLDLLSALADSVVFPATVLRELEAGTDHDDAARQVTATDSLLEVANLELPDRIRNWDLGPGESQVLAFARANREYEAVIDDRGARRCARALGISYTGTLGVILKCRQQELIPAARPLVEALQTAGIRLAPALVEAALAEVGEARE